MRRSVWPILLRAATAVLVLALLAAAWAWLAGAACFLLNQRLPRHIGLGTWWLYWQAYGGDAVQHRRLLLAALLPALALAALLALLLVLLLRPPPRALYGDARWASRAEIRAAGLL